jgi:predicted TIM-barrel fold metal-dependent hydrolase
MIIDLHAHLGPYAFRRLPHQSASEFLNLMERHGIHSAVVCSNSSLLYRDAHAGNQELQRDICGQSRFYGVATIDPTYAGWQRDLEQAIDEWHFKAVRLLPNYHGYRLDSAAGLGVLQWCAARSVPVMLPQRIEDRRQQHRWDDAKDLVWDDIAPALRLQDGLKVLLTNWLGLNASAIREAGLRERLLIDLARFDVVLFQNLQPLLNELGAQSIAFGSHAPFNYYAPALVRLETLPASTAERAQIAAENCARFLKIKL